MTVAINLPLTQRAGAFTDHQKLTAAVPDGPLHKVSCRSATATV